MIQTRFTSTQKDVKLHRNIEVPDDFILLNGEFNEAVLRSRAYQEFHKRDPELARKLDKFEWRFK